MHTLVAVLVKYPEIEFYVNIPLETYRLKFPGQIKKIHVLKAIRKRRDIIDTMDDSALKEFTFELALTIPYEQEARPSLRERSY